MSATTEPVVALAPRLLILEYHRVAEVGPEKLRPWRIEPRLFAQHMRHIAESGLPVTTPSRWFADPAPGESLAITFDDAYEDFDSHAWPTLRGLGLMAEVYVPTAFVGRSSEWDHLHGTAPLMSWTRIRELSGEGVSFNSHGHAHRPLTRLTDAEVAEDVRVAKRTLEDELGAPVDTIAYPYGAQDARVHEVVRNCGYTFGVTVESGVCSTASSRLQLPRFEVPGDCDVWSFADRVSALLGRPSQSV